MPGCLCWGAVKYGPEVLESAELSPSDVPCSDIVSHAVRTNALPFLVRELRARVGNYYSRREEIAALQLQSRSTGACGYNRPCAHQYIGKSQSCMVENGRLILHAS